MAMLNNQRVHLYTRRSEHPDLYVNVLVHVKVIAPPPYLTPPRICQLWVLVHVKVITPHHTIQNVAKHMNVMKIKKRKRVVFHPQELVVSTSSETRSRACRNHPR